MRRRRLFMGICAVGLCALGGTSFADWPMARHDARRTGAATGQSDIQSPIAYWKRYLGGSLPSEAMVVADVDGDGASEFVMIAGGSAVAKDRSDHARWTTPNLDLIEIVGLADLDGDSADELVVRSTDRVYVLTAATGEIRWREPAGEMGTIGGTRLGDVDGDARPDLLIAECGCCQVRGPNPGFAYSFAAGADAPTALWELPGARCGGHHALTLVSPSGAGPLDVLFGDNRELVLLDGRTGAELARTPQLGTRIQTSGCVPADIDGAAGEELVCVHDDKNVPDERAVFALRYAGGALSVVWSTPIAAAASGALAWVDVVTDLDQDGLREVVVSGSDDGLAWTTYVLGAADGQLVATLPDALVAGVAPTAAGEVLLTQAGLDVTGWRKAGAAVAPVFTIPDAIVPQALDSTRAARSSLSGTATLARVDSDDLRDVVVRSRSAPNTIVGYGVTGGAATELARFLFPAGVQAQQMFPLDTVDDDLQLAVARDDGLLTPFDRSLLPVRPTDDDVGQLALRTGGYYATGILRTNNTLRAASLGAGPARILAVDSRGSLVALDASLGSFAAPPRPMWDLAGGFSAAVVPGLVDGGAGIACLARDQPATTPPTYSVVALAPDGTTAWRRAAPTTPLGDVVAGNLDGDAVPDLVLQWGAPSDSLLRTEGLRGTDGQSLWSAVPVDPSGGRKPRGVALADFDGDGRDDVFHQVLRTQVLSGADGGELATSAAGMAYAMPMLLDVDGDGGLEVVLSGGLKPVDVLDHDLSPLRALADDDPFPDGALAACPGGRQVLVEGSERFSARLKLTDLTGPTGGTERTVVLAGGALYADEAAAQGVALLGQLTTATVHADLTGLGRPTALLGSSDGWLYGVDPCAGGLHWSYDFQAPVGEAITADTDGDGRDEILVTVADGYLYTLKNFELAAPAVVADTDPFSDASDDLAALVTVSSLEATWTPVQGADRYEVAVVDAAGAYVGTPWRDAGRAVSLLMTDLPLVDGFYRVAVRAYRPDGHVSVDTVSNGLFVTIGEPVETPDGGCGCRSSSPADGLVLVLVALGLTRRRRAAA